LKTTNLFITLIASVLTSVHFISELIVSSE